MLTIGYTPPGYVPKKTWDNRRGKYRFQRPRGRARKGFVWSEDDGCFVVVAKAEDAKEDGEKASTEAAAEGAEEEAKEEAPVTVDDAPTLGELDPGATPSTMLSSDETMAEAEVPRGKDKEAEEEAEEEASEVTVEEAMEMKKRAWLLECEESQHACQKGEEQLNEVTRRMFGYFKSGNALVDEVEVTKAESLREIMAAEEQLNEVTQRMLAYFKAGNALMDEVTKADRALERETKKYIDLKQIDWNETNGRYGWDETNGFEAR